MSDGISVRAIVKAERGAGKAWDAFFDTHDDVDYVLIDVRDRQVLDVTVYWKHDPQGVPWDDLDANGDDDVRLAIEEILL